MKFSLKKIGTLLEGHSFVWKPWDCDSKLFFFMNFFGYFSENHVWFLAGNYLLFWQENSYSLIPIYSAIRDWKSELDLSVNSSEMYGKSRTIGPSPLQIITRNWEFFSEIRTRIPTISIHHAASFWLNWICVKIMSLLVRIVLENYDFMNSVFFFFLYLKRSQLKAYKLIGLYRKSKVECPKSPSLDGISQRISFPKLKSCSNKKKNIILTSSFVKMSGFEPMNSK